MSRCVIASCTVDLPTRVDYLPIGDGQYLQRTRVDQDALRAHLLSEHRATRTHRLRVAS